MVYCGIERELIVSVVIYFHELRAISTRLFQFLEALIEVETIERCFILYSDHLANFQMYMKCICSVAPKLKVCWCHLVALEACYN